MWSRSKLDDHAVNHHVFDALRFRAAAYDRAVTALIEDIYERNLDDRVMVVVTGEFGRTPKIEYQPSTGEGNASAPAGSTQPGRDHWPRAFSNIWAGGGIRTGQCIGATDKRGEDVIERHCGPVIFSPRSIITSASIRPKCSSKISMVDRLRSSITANRFQN